MKIGCWKKNRFIEQYNTDIVFPCHEEIRSVKTERHHNCVLWIFLELHVAAAWQKCDMFSFGEIPTFKRYRGGAERYRLYEHEFPSREYNLPAWRSHYFVLVTSSYSCIKKKYFLNWLNYWPAISALVYMYLHVQWLDHLELKGSVSWFWEWLSLNLNWHSYQDKNSLTVTDCPYRAMNSE